QRRAERDHVRGLPRRGKNDGRAAVERAHPADLRQERAGVFLDCLFFHRRAARSRSDCERCRQHEELLHTTTSCSLSWKTDLTLGANPAQSTMNSCLTRVLGGADRQAISALALSRLGASGRLGGERIVGPIVLRIAPLQIFLHVRISPLPKAR